MSLDADIPYPRGRCYVLRLSAPPAGDGGLPAGRIEHVESGAGAGFADAGALLGWLQAHAGTCVPDTPG